MDADEREIFEFLKTRSSDFTNAMEICRRAGNKKKFHDDPNWAKPVLQRMEERNILESDQSGRFRIKPVSRKHKKQWVAPDIAKILAESGVTAEGGVAEEQSGIAEDEHYENL
jgi:hypothetical protein